MDEKRALFEAWAYETECFGVRWERISELPLLELAKATWDAGRAPLLARIATLEQKIADHNALLREVAALKRYNPNAARPNHVSKNITLNVPAELARRIDVAIAADCPRDDMIEIEGSWT